MTRLRSVTRGLLSLAALVVLLVAVPAALARWGQLPGLPDGDWWDRLSDTAVSDRTVFVALTLAAWAAWAVFATSVVVEMSAALRGIQAPRLAIAGPIQRTARGLIVGVMLLVSVAHNTPGAFASTGDARAGHPLPARTDATTVVVDLPASPRSPPDAFAPPPTTDPTVTSAPDAPTQPAGAVVVVRHGDSPWELADTYLGTGLRWRELWDLNRGVPQPDGRAWTDPQLIVPGWELRLPADASVASDSPTTQPPPDHVSTVHVVERGDTLSGLAAHYLGDASHYRDIFDANTDRVQPDGRRLTDPNLIVVGWELTIPTAAPPTTDPTTTVPPAAADPTTSDTAPPDASAGELPPPSPPEVEAIPPAATAPPSPPSSSAPTTPTTVAAPTTTAPASPVSTATRKEDDSSAPLLAGLGGAVVLATGLAVQFRRLRRRRGVRGARHAATPPSPIESVALTAADVPLVRWAGQRIANMMATLDRRLLAGRPLAIELSESAGIEVLWDAPQEAPTPAQWSAADGGWAWRLVYDPEEDVPADDLPATIPALVTIGRREDRQLLIDLEAFGTIAVSGQSSHSTAFARSIALELATNNDLADAYVITSGLALPDAIAPRYRLTGAESAGAALAQLAHARESVDTLLGHERSPDTFAARTGTSTPIEVTVVVADAGAADDIANRDLADIAPPRRGVAIVVTGDRATARARVVIDDTGRSARLEPLGIDFTPVGITDNAADALEAAVASLATLPDNDEFRADQTAAPSVAAHGNGTRQDHDATGQPDSSPPSPSTTNGDGVPADAIAMESATTGLSSGDAVGTDTNGQSTDGRLFDVQQDPRGDERSGRLLVRVLGVPRVEGRPDIGRREVILTALLACRGGKLASSAVQDALWGGRPIEAKTMWNFVAATRRALGTFPDGTAVMPAADRSRGTLRLDRRVTTDVALLHDAVDQADQLSSSEAIALLRDALSLVEGPPFDAAGCDWAHRDQDVAEATTLIERSVERLVALALDAGDIGAARDAISRGLRGLPGDEVLYRLRMRVESAAGNHAGVVAAYDELSVYLADLDAQPAAATAALYHELVRQPSAGRVT
ncbi:MAG: BTAD domain-containing putative transcriptional regulator [Ilumatobacteraceae bacterium]